ncbi:PDR/VanB family oxidoreductase [Streptosporangium lutulentum]|uniref:Ferredoxin-NADP reductase n=1 Tax=Streptosporangium lutulentum TaxID=1461250 RepID=A0ABT9QMG0_9ACTN|nr:PDR/VanB family oxidoreductase [Streptosporangium lutulentum]MDP9847897.1 ferredoxin-NADP reductase [Streptosporangium lutulentum]
MNIETKVVVAGKDLIADGVVSLTLRAAGGEPLPRWQPGAHIDLLLGDTGLVRQYSLCGDPADTTVWRVAVLREPDGRGGSAWVHDRLDVGTEMSARGPRNHFPFTGGQRCLFIAGGIGITPLLPMVEAADRAGTEWRLIYGGRSRASMAFLGELARYGDRVTVRPQDETGLLDLDDLFREPHELVYSCGPEPLLAAVEERCTGGTLRVERFTPTSIEGPETAFEVELAQSGLTVSVPPGTSVLDAVTAAGVQVLSSCGEGTCGTCETVVLDGVPEHRDSILTEEEREAADYMMICVSRSRTPRLVLEL